MKIVLFRHAQKGITPFDNPELTEEGFKQAEMIYELIKKNILPHPTQAWASPKIRTTQTLTPACENFKIRIQETELLDLRTQHESSSDFRKRISSFLNQFDESASAETHFLCTHYDWIEEAMTLINCDKDLNSFEFSHWMPTQFIVFEIRDSKWMFVKKGSAHATKAD